MPSLIHLLVLLSLVIASAKAAAAISVRLGQPAVLGELLAGVILGPTVLDVLAWALFAAPIGTVHLSVVVNQLGDIGLILLMLIAGLETDLRQMRTVGVTAFWAASGGVVVPMLGGIATAAAFGFPVFWTGLFIGTILTATSVSISAQTLIELGVLKSKEGATILGAAIIDDVLGIIVLSVVVALAQAGSVSGLDIALIIGRMGLFFAAAILVGALFERLLARADSLNVAQGLLAAVVSLTFLYAWAAEALGHVAAITGAYLAGALLTRTRFAPRIREGLHPLAYSMLVPLFFVSIGLRVNARDLGPHAAFTVVLVLVAVVGKVLGSGGAARLCGFSTLESMRVGVGMISRGEVGLIIAAYGLGRGVIDREIFAAAVLMVVATTMITPPLLRLAYPRAAVRPAGG